MTRLGRSVLIVSWEYPPIVEGGLARHVGRLSGGLVDAGIAVHVLTRGDRAPAEALADGALVHRVPAADWPADPGRFFAWVGRMNAGFLEAGRALAERFDFDLIHGHDWLVADAAVGLADELDRPLVMTIHATEYGRHQGWIVGQPQTRIHLAERGVVHRADRVIACSEFMRGHISDVFSIDEARIAMIPNGVDRPDPADPAELARVAELAGLVGVAGLAGLAGVAGTAGVAGLAGVRTSLGPVGERLVLLVGRLVYEKGFQLALDALPGLIARNPGVRFVVAGAGVGEAQLRAQASGLGLDRHGSFLGWVDDPTLRALYRLADVCVVPSIYEPSGLVALEAMASGCTCVVADTGGLREAVPHEAVGLRFTTRDPQALAAAVERVLRDDALRRRLVAAAADHVRRFDWREIAGRTAGIYDEVLAAGGGTAPAGAGTAAAPG